MKRAILTSLAVLTVWCGIGTNFAAAQFGTLGQQPRINPFVNPGVNNWQGGNFSYGILRPPFDPAQVNNPFYATQRLNPDGSLQGQLGNQGTMNALGGLQTGHTVTFFDYDRFFPLNVPTGSTGSLGSQTQGGFSGHGNQPSGLIGTGTITGFQRR